MFIALIGTRFAGKLTVKDYLVKQQGFIPIRINQLTKNRKGLSQDIPKTNLPDPLVDVVGTGQRPKLEVLSNVAPSQQGRPTSFLMMSSPISPSSLQHIQDQQPTHSEQMKFQTPAQLLEHVTRNWRSNFVTLDLYTLELLETFLTRPFFMVVCVDAPLLHRFRRSSSLGYGANLEEFVQEHDAFYYGTNGRGDPHSDIYGAQSPGSPSLRTLSRLAQLHVVNSFETISGFHRYLDNLKITSPERLRPGWDTYFMQLATLASHRSNCMKRRVGAILVRNNRILATGYNGTPRGLTNCNEGGCIRCNNSSETSDECVCLHAEENALLEAGRDRVGDGSVLYCNTCPCLKCTIKIIQTGVREVVYNLSYKVDDASAALFEEAGIKLRRHAPPPGIQ